VKKQKQQPATTEDVTESRFKPEDKGDIEESGIEENAT